MRLSDKEALGVILLHFHEMLTQKVPKETKQGAKLLPVHQLCSHRRSADALSMTPATPTVEVSALTREK